jgi:hypothetical protein
VAPERGNSGDPRYRALLDEMWELHCEKADGYGSDNDPLANLRDAEEWGLPNFMGAFLRAGDKFKRLKNHVRKGTIPGDNLHNDARDGAAYLLLGLILWEEDQESKVAS